MNEIEQKCVSEGCGDIGNQEVWKDIPGYEGLYQVSNLGKVKSLARQVFVRKRQFLRNYEEQIASPAIGSSGYYEIKLTKNYKGKIYRVHRLVSLVFLKNPNNLPEINHKDCNKLNNNVNNFEWCNGSHNVQHAYDNGLMIPKSGELNGCSRFTNEDILKMRELYIPHKFGYVKIAKIFKTNPNVIMRIIKKESWKHI